MTDYKSIRITFDFEPSNIDISPEYCEIARKRLVATF